MKAVILFFCFCLACFAQAKEPVRILFWNTENLFDLRDNPQKKDDEFLADGDRRWSFFRYRKKLLDVMKTLVAAGEGEPPAIVGLCEIENDSVWTDLQRLTPIYRLGYRSIMTNSPDERGINIALLYRRHRFKPLHWREIIVSLPPPHGPTRNILHISGLLSPRDTIDLFVCHFPSRRGGEQATRNARLHANKQLKIAIDSLAMVRVNPQIVVMGDMNDYPLCRNQEKVFQMRSAEDSTSCSSHNKVQLYNLMASMDKKKGSHKYNGSWGYLDQFFANALLLQGKQNLRISSAHVFEAPFLLVEDTKYFGLRPKRTYYGFRYEGGASDHLPIVVDLLWK